MDLIKIKLENWALQISHLPSNLSFLGSSGKALHHTKVF